MIVMNTSNMVSFSISADSKVFGRIYRSPYDIYPFEKNRTQTISVVLAKPHLNRFLAPKLTSGYA